MPTVSGLPYPSSSAVPDVPGDIYALAAATGTLLAAPPANVKFTAPSEVTTVSATAATGTVQFNAKTQGVLVYTSNASADWTLNVRGDASTTLASLLATGQSITVNFLVTQGTTAYKHTALTIDGSAATVKWQGGTAPASGNASAVDGYTFTIIKTAATPTYTVFGVGPTKFA